MQGSDDQREQGSAIAAVFVDSNRCDKRATTRAHGQTFNACPDGAALTRDEPHGQPVVSQPPAVAGLVLVLVHGREGFDALHAFA